MGALSTHVCMAGCWGDQLAPGASSLQLRTPALLLDISLSHRLLCCPVAVQGVTRLHRGPVVPASVTELSCPSPDLVPLKCRCSRRLVPASLRVLVLPAASGGALVAFADGGEIAVSITFSCTSLRAALPQCMLNCLEGLHMPRDQNAPGNVSNASK